MLMKKKCSPLIITHFWAFCNNNRNDRLKNMAYLSRGTMGSTPLISTMII